MLEWYQDFLSTEKLFLALPGFPGKLRLCNNSCTIHRTCTNVDTLKKCNSGARTKETRNYVGAVSRLYFRKENLFLALSGFPGKMALV